jgi:hypothetical protein
MYMMHVGAGNVPNPTGMHPLQPGIAARTNRKTLQRANLQQHKPYHKPLEAKPAKAVY